MQLENQDLRNQKYIVEVVNDMKVFIGGSKTILELDGETKSVLDSLCAENAYILVGDCFG
jgi:hypothetical protein